MKAVQPSGRATWLRSLTVRQLIAYLAEVTILLEEPALQEASIHSCQAIREEILRREHELA